MREEGSKPTACHSDAHTWCDDTCSLGSSTGLKANQSHPSFSPVTKQMLRVTHRLAKVKNLLLPRPSGSTEGGSKPRTGCRKERKAAYEEKTKRYNSKDREML